MSNPNDCTPRRPDRENQGLETSFKVSEIKWGWKMENLMRKVSLGSNGLAVLFSLLAFITTASNWMDFDRNVEYWYVLAAVAIPAAFYVGGKAVRKFGELWTAKRLLQRRNSTLSSLDGEQASESESAVVSTSTQSTCSSSINPWKYDVFLSFHGKDTRNNFTDHLHASLKQKGVRVFKDDKNLKRGTYISQELLKTIQESQYAIVIISKNYASSKWCLMELTKIMECIKETQLTIFPVFYHVDPSAVRNQRDSFAEAFVEHCRDPKVDEKQRKMWIDALKEVGHLSGWHVYNRSEVVTVEEICREIVGGLCRDLSNISKDLVGIEYQIEQILTLLCLGLDDVRFIGIYGMGGIGKTTLSKVIYEMVIPHFEAKCFIACIREESKNGRLCHLQKQIISQILGDRKTKIWNDYDGSNEIASRLCSRKVLIVLDDVDGEEQLKALAKCHDWFGPGSRIVVTSRDHHLLIKYMDSTYKVNLLSDYQALELFSRKAFKKQYLEENYIELSKDIVSYAKGLPLAIEVFGLFLFGRTMEEWESARDLLKNNPNSNILDKLQISFDGLERLQKELFLDISCFFNRTIVNEVLPKLEGLGYYPKINIPILVDKSLVEIVYSKIQVHDLLQNMGQQIVHRQSPSEPGGLRRLWRHKDIIHVLKNNTGTDVVESIILKLPLDKQEQLSFDTFSKMKNLKMLEINLETLVTSFIELHGNIYWGAPHDIEFIKNDKAIMDDLCTVLWHGDVSKFILSNKLCILEWWGYPLESLPANFQSDDLINLIMPRSFLKQLWNGNKSFVKLKHIDLNHSQNLIETPDFSGVLNLEELDLSYCTSLSKVDPSIGFLKQLKKLSLRDCRSLEQLTNQISLPSLIYLDLKGCLRLKKFPDVVGVMKCLQELDTRGAIIEQLPSLAAIGKELRILTLGANYSKPVSAMLPGSFSALTSLTKLRLVYCNFQDGLLPDLGSLSSLRKLDLSGNKFTRIPERIYQLSKLGTLYLKDCSMLQVVPKLPSSLRWLNVRGCHSLEPDGDKIDVSNISLFVGYHTLACYFGYDGKTYKIDLSLPRSFTRYNGIASKVRSGIAWGTTLQSKIPGCFLQRTTSSFERIRSPIDFDSEDYSKIFVAYFLFVVYERFDGNNQTVPKFVCELQVDGNAPGVPLVFCASDVPPVGPSGIWLFIDDLSLFGLLNRPKRLSYLETSIATSNQNVKVKEYGVRLVHLRYLSVSEYYRPPHLSPHHLSEFYEVLSSISPHCVDEELRDRVFDNKRHLLGSWRYRVESD